MAYQIPKLRHSCKQHQARCGLAPRLDLRNWSTRILFRSNTRIKCCEHSFAPSMKITMAISGSEPTTAVSTDIRTVDSQISTAQTDSSVTALFAFSRTTVTGSG